MKLGFIGTGNMASAIMGGIIKNNVIPAEEIIGADLFAPGRERVQKEYGINVTADNKEVAQKAETIILSVKPQFYESVIADIKDVVTDKQIIITIAPGKTLAWLAEQFGKDVKIVRTMPNTPAMVGEGMTAVCPNEHLTEDEIAYVKSKWKFTGVCIHADRSYGRCSSFRRNAKKTGLSVCSTGCSWKCKDGSGYRKTSWRIKRYGLFTGRNNN